MCEEQVASIHTMDGATPIGLLARTYKVIGTVLSNDFMLGLESINICIRIVYVVTYPGTAIWNGSSLYLLLFMIGSTELCIRFLLC